MKRIFPMYKGNSLDKAGFGYSSIQSAKHYMDERPVQKDFDATLPERYWYEFEYVYKHNGREMSSHIYAVSNYTFHDTDYEDPFYIKDLTGEDKELWDKVFAIEDEFRGHEWLKDKEVEKELSALYIELDKRGWYYSLFENEVDYWKKYRKYKKENIQFVEKDVKIEVK